MLSQSYLKDSKQPEGEQILFNIIMEQAKEHIDACASDGRGEEIDWNDDEMLDDELQNELFNEELLTYEFPHMMLCKSYILTKWLSYLSEEIIYDGKDVIDECKKCYDDDHLVNCYALMIWNEGLKDALKEHYLKEDEPTFKDGKCFPECDVGSGYGCANQECSEYDPCGIYGEDEKEEMYWKNKSMESE